MDTKISSSVMKPVARAVHGTHVDQDVLPQTLSSFSLNATSLTESIFYLPNTVYSLGESSLSFNLAVTAAAANFNNLWALGNVCIDSISLYNSAGVYLANIDSHGEFSRAVLPLKTDSTELHSLDSSLGSTTLALSKAGDRGGGMASSNFIASSTFTVGPSGTRLVGSAYASANRGYLEPQYVKAIGAAAGATFYNVCIPFTQFVHTILADKENAFWNDQLQLRIRWSPCNKIGYDNGSTTLTTLTSPTALVAASVADLKVILAVEKSPDAVALAVAKTKSGYSKLIPYVYTFNQSSAGTSSSQQIQLNRGFGKRLLNTVCVSYNNLSSSGFTAWDINNLANEKITSFNTYLDSAQLQINNVLCNNSDDYVLMKSMLRDTVTGLSSNVYKHNHVWVDSWRDPNISYSQYDDSVADGLDLSVNRTYALNKIQPSATLRDFIFCIVQRELSVGPGGIMIA